MVNSRINKKLNENKKNQSLKGESTDNLGQLLGDPVVSKANTRKQEQKNSMLNDLMKEIDEDDEKLSIEDDDEQLF